MDWWVCTDCGRSFVHARLWAKHRREVHNKPSCRLLG